MNAKLYAFFASFLKTRAIGVALLVIGLALLAGCVSPDAANQIKNFSSAVSLTMSNTAAAYALVNKTHMDEQISYFVAAGDPVKNIDSFTPTDFLSEKDIHARADILNRLQIYAAKLSTLMGNPDTNLDQETTKLDEKLETLNDDVVTNLYMGVLSTDSTNFSSPVTDNDLEIFTAAVNGLTYWIIKLKEQSEAKKCIETMQSPTNLPAICHVLTNDFVYLSIQLDNDEAQILENEKHFIRVNAGHMDPFQQRTEALRLIALKQGHQKSDAVLEDTQESITKLLAAHQALDDAFTTNSFKLSSLINEVSSQGQRISSYYQSLQTNN